MWSSIMAVLPIIKMVMGLLITTPEERLGEVSKEILRVLSEVRDGVQDLKENAGDTSSLEDAINGARRRNK